MTTMCKPCNVLSTVLLLSMMAVLLLSGCQAPSEVKTDLNASTTEVAVDDDTVPLVKHAIDDNAESASKPAVNLNDFLIQPDLKQAGLIKPDSSYESLKKHVGKKHIKRGDVYVAEGFCESGAILYPHDSRRQVQIFWGDKVNESHPTSVQILDQDSWWKLPYDIGMGTTAMALYELNGKTFSFAGTGWDYGGYIHHWSEGNLDAPLMGVSIRLAEILAEEGSDKEAPELLDEKNYSRIVGDQTVEAASVYDLLNHLEVIKISYTFLDNQARFPDEGDNQHECQY